MKFLPLVLISIITISGTSLFAAKTAAPAAPKLTAFEMEMSKIEKTLSRRAIKEVKEEKEKRKFKRLNGTDDNLKANSGNLNGKDNKETIIVQNPIEDLNNYRINSIFKLNGENFVSIEYKTIKNERIKNLYKLDGYFLGYKIVKINFYNKSIILIKEVEDGEDKDGKKKIVQKYFSNQHTYDMEAKIVTRQIDKLKRVIIKTENNQSYYDLNRIKIVQEKINNFN